MKKFAIIVVLIFNGILLQGQIKNAKAIHIHTNDTLKSVALEKFVNYLIENNILFLDTDYKNGVAKSEEFRTTTWAWGDYDTQSIIMLIAKKGLSSVTITITGYTKNFTPFGENRVTMVNKSNKHVGGAMFQQVKVIAEKYKGADSITYTKP
jgi:hypothetical protein